MKRTLWKFLSTALIILLLSGIFCGVALGALDIKVGYYDYDDFLIVDEENNISGYAGEILDMLVQENAHWHFVPVKFDRGTFLQNMSKGFAVLSIQSPYGTNNPRFFVYSEQPVGVELGIFYASPDQAINYEDFETFDGMRVGAINGDMQNDLFAAYQRENGFSTEYIIYNTLDAMKQALFNREIDGLIYGSMVEQADLMVIARYAETPLHIAANVWGETFIAYFDRVLSRVTRENPDFLEDLYDKYFGEAPAAMQAMTVEEQAEMESQIKAEGEKQAAEEIRPVVEEKSGTDARQAVAATVPGTMAPDYAPEADGNERKLTQIGFLAGVALLVILMAVAITRKSSGKAAKQTIAETAGYDAGLRTPEEAFEDKAEAETRNRAKEEERRRAEEAARRQVEEEAQRQAKEEAQRQVEEAARRQAEEKAQRQAEEEAKRQAEEAAAIKRERITEIADHESAQSNAGRGYASGIAEDDEEDPGKNENQYSNRSGKIEMLPGWLDEIAGMSNQKIETGEVTEYTDEQIRGEIYLSGLTFSLQPRYSLDHNNVIGAEVSIFCRHPIRDRVYPEELVLSLTQKGKLHILDRYIFESICLCKPQDKIHPDEDFEIVIPVFTESVVHPEFSRWYIDTVKNYGVPPALFRLDLVYRWQADQDPLVYQSLGKLTDAGFKTALKDVGNINYPLSLLSEVELEAIVVSEQLIIDALVNEKKKRLLAALKGICTQMDFRMEADRIDSREKFQLLSDVGCQVYQGNFLTRAIPFEQFWEYKRKLDVRSA